MGFKKDLFKDSSQWSFLLCFICEDVVKDPTSCKSCEQIYCSDCINKIANNFCTKCQTNFIAQEVSSNIKAIWNNLDVTCLQCKQQVKLEDYVSNHQVGCGSFVPNKLQYQDQSSYDSESQSKSEFHSTSTIYCQQCNAKLTQSQLNNHEEQCEYQEIFCPNQGCGQSIKRKDLEKHRVFECQFKQEYCQHCKQMVNLKFHQRECKAQNDNQSKTWERDLIKRKQTRSNSQSPKTQPTQGFTKKRSVDSRAQQCCNQVCKCSIF